MATPNPFADADPPKNPLPSQATNDQVNPYASPLTPSALNAETVAIWRDGKYVVAHRDAGFPHVCIRTGHPAKRAYRVNLRWSYPIDFSHRTVAFDVGLCESCIRQYRRRRIFGWLLLLASVAVVAIIVKFNLFTFAIVLAGLGFVYGVSLASGPAVALKVKKVKQPFFWISGACATYLDRLPTSPPT